MSIYYGRCKYAGNASGNLANSDIKECIISEYTPSGDLFPIPAPGEKVTISMGKIKNFFESIRAWKTNIDNWTAGVCLIGSIVNNCVTNNARLPLSAAQGKVLMDHITALSNSLSSLNAQLSSLNSTKANTNHTHSSLTAGNYHVIMQGDGNLVIYRISDSRVVWSASGSPYKP